MRVVVRCNDLAVERFDRDEAKLVTQGETVGQLVRCDCDAADLDRLGDRQWLGRASNEREDKEADRKEEAFHSGGIAGNRSYRSVAIKLTSRSRSG